MFNEECTLRKKGDEHCQCGWCQDPKNRAERWRAYANRRIEETRECEKIPSEAWNWTVNAREHST
jgi:hypothetical protein